LLPERGFEITNSVDWSKGARTPQNLGDPEDGDLGITGSGLDERLYYLTDANMNVTALLDTGGDAVERYVYDPYGKVTIYDATWTSTRSSSSYENAILFCGYRRDSETGLYDVRNRTYHPTPGRWLQRDPLGYIDGPSLYEYVGGAPAVGTDPAGLFGPFTPVGLAMMTGAIADWILGPPRTQKPCPEGGGGGRPGRPTAQGRRSAAGQGQGRGPGAAGRRSGYFGGRARRVLLGGYRRPGPLLPAQGRRGGLRLGLSGSVQRVKS
jgi:RHS repeat-associated protein